MKLALYQCPSPAGDLDAGLIAVDTALAGAASAGASLLVMPELFLPGYVATSKEPPVGWDSALDRLRDTIRKHGVALAIGLPEFAGDTTFNGAVFVTSDGDELARYRKIQLFGETEQSLFQPGDNYCVFDWNGVRFALLICYDVEFPEHVRPLKRQGVEVILVPTANMAPFDNVNRFMVPSRAAENALTILYANYCGDEEPLTYVGQSVICGPDGEPLAQAGVDAALLVADLPKTTAIPPATQLVDLRSVPGKLSTSRFIFSVVLNSSKETLGEEA